MRSSDRCRIHPVGQGLAPCATCQAVHHAPSPRPLDPRIVAEWRLLNWCPPQRHPLPVPVQDVRPCDWRQVPHAGPSVLHCGAWHAVTVLPFACPICGVRLFEEVPHGVD